MKKILVATDLSERGDRAVRRAMRLAGDHKGVCRVLHVVDDVLPNDIALHLRAEAQARLERFVDANKGAAEVESVVAIGDPLDVIPAEVKAFAAELLVLGLHRTRAFLDGLRETTMERLVRLMRTPVLLVHEPADHDYQKVLAPVSFSPACAAAIAAVRHLAPNADVTAFHAVYLPFTGLTGERPGGAMDHELTHEARAVMAAWREKEGLGGDLTVGFQSGALEDVFRHRLAADSPDLIALGAHTRGPLSPSVLGSFAAGLIRDPPTDVLLAHP